MKNIDGSYLASLPERTVRAVVSIATGVSSLTVKILLPDFLRNTTVYRVTFGMLQQFLIEKVAQIESQESPYRLKDKYAARKVAGTVLEGIGLVSVHFSPVWALAILSDVADGSTVYLKKLIEDLKEDGLVDPEGEYDSVTMLLEGIREGSRIGASAIDMPPIDAKEWEKTYREMEAIFQQMKKVSKENRISINRLSGAMSIDLMKRMGKTSGKLMADTMLDSYRRSLDEMAKTGAVDYIQNHMRPFVRQVGVQFEKNRPSVTERLIETVKNKFKSRKK